jgi:hypothetical protein
MFSAVCVVILNLAGNLNGFVSIVQAGSLSQDVGLVGFFPAEVAILATEVTVGSGGFIAGF